ncbi:MAG: flagellar export protein FliJ [Acidimicrobiales bacterium]
MKRYSFRLEHVARVRRIQEEQARAELLAARQRLIRAGADLSLRSDEYERNRSAGRRADTRAFRSDRDQDDRLTQAVIAARVAEANARLLVGQRSEEWTHAARELSALERLDERRRAEHAAEELRLDQIDLDELVAPRVAAKNREDS